MIDFPVVLAIILLIWLIVRLLIDITRLRANYFSRKGEIVMIEGRPISELPTEPGTIIIAEIMNYYGVPETGGYGFEHVILEKPGDWMAYSVPSNLSIHYGSGHRNFLRWWPNGTDMKNIELTKRTNWNFIPSNGTEGSIFYERWCCNCIHERMGRKSNFEDYSKRCNIFSRTLLYGIADSDYPTEWTYDRKTMQPKCTAFESDIEQPLNEREPIRCQETPDIFGDK